MVHVDGLVTILHPRHISSIFLFFLFFHLFFLKQKNGFHLLHQPDLSPPSPPPPTSLLCHAVHLLHQRPLHSSPFICSSTMASLSLLCPPSSSLGLRTPSSFSVRTPSTKSFCIRAQSAPVLTQDQLKKLAADKAVDYVKSGMVLGLGLGSTAAFVVSKLGELIKSGELTNIVGVPTSKRTKEQARSLGIPLSILDDHPHIDLAIDGADEVDPDLNLVKGRGGALLREKMVEAASDKFVVVADDTKLVDGLGGRKKG